MVRRLHPLAVAALVAGGGPAGAQQLLWELPAFGSTILSENDFDLDQDGFGDFLYGGVAFSGYDGSVLKDFQSYWRVDAVADFGFSGDTRVDFVATELGVIFSTPSTVYALSGANGAPLDSLPFGFTFQQANTVRWVGDVTGDGVGDVLVAADGFEGCIGPTGTIALFSGAAPSFTPIYFDQTGPDEPYYLTDPAGDVNGDGIGDFATSRGCDLKHDIVLWSAVGGNVVKLSTLPTTIDPNLSLPGRFSAFGDWNLDGCDDFLLAEPVPGDSEEVRIVSGLDHAVLATFADAGDYVASPGDVNCDGVPDFLASQFNVVTRLFSGADGSVLWTAPEPAMGVVSVGDIDADGVPDFGLRLTGKVQVWSGPGPPIIAYCTGKATSQGCVPAVGTAGTPAASADDDFFVSADDALLGKPGLFFWSTSGPAAVPFLGGTLCALPPLRRGPVLVSAGAADCLASYSFFFSQGYALSSGLFGGETVWGQFWMRDPAHPDGTGVTLSDAVEFAWCP